MSFTVDQIEALELDWDDFEYGSDEVLRKALRADTVKVVVQYGGEGDGAPISLVFSVDDELFEKHGTYSSWDSSYWDGPLYKVTPYQEMVTKYKPVIE